MCRRTCSIVSAVSRLDHVMAGNIEQTPAAIRSSVAAVFVVVWQAVRIDSVASTMGAVHALILEGFEFIERGPFDVAALGPLRDERNEPEQKCEEGEPGHGVSGR